MKLSAYRSLELVSLSKTNFCVEFKEKFLSNRLFNLWWIQKKRLNIFYWMDCKKRERDATDKQVSYCFFLFTQNTETHFVSLIVWGGHWATGKLLYCHK